MATDGDGYIRRLAQLIRSNEKRLAEIVRRGHGTIGSNHMSTNTSSSGMSLLNGLLWATNSSKPITLSLTPHYLFFLLSRIEQALQVPVGPMNIRFEFLHNEYQPANYVSFLNAREQSRRRDLSESAGLDDSASIRSVSSIKSVISAFSIFGSWSSSSLSAEKAAEQSAAEVHADLKYIYSALTKLPSLRLASDRQARLIAGYEEFPFDTAVPLHAFKNVTLLEISDLDIRLFYGWDVVSEGLRSLTVRRGGIQEVSELMVDIILDDADGRRRRSSKQHHVPSDADLPSSPAWTRSKSFSVYDESPTASSSSRNRSSSPNPAIPTTVRSNSYNARHRSFRNPRRSNTISSTSSSNSHASDSMPLPASKWQFLKHLCIADNSLTLISAHAFTSLASTLVSLDLSDNLLIEIPDCLSTLTHLRSLSLANNMITSLHGFHCDPSLNLKILALRGNRLTSFAGIEYLPMLERVDLRENNISDPAELLRLTSAHKITDIWVAGNPFTMSHASTFRILIFNYFRRNGIISDDIRLDGQTPSLNERRLLIDRLPSSLNAYDQTSHKPSPAVAFDENSITVVTVPKKRQHIPPPLTTQTSMTSESTTETEDEDDSESHSSPETPRAPTQPSGHGPTVTTHTSNVDTLRSTMQAGQKPKWVNALRETDVWHVSPIDKTQVLAASTQ